MSTDQAASGRIGVRSRLSGSQIRKNSPPAARSIDLRFGNFNGALHFDEVVPQDLSKRFASDIDDLRAI
jgi:hypothetical protein